MATFNDERADFQELMRDLGKIYADGRQGDVLDIPTLTRDTEQRVKGFFELADSDDRVRVKIDPLARKAVVTILPSDIVTVQMHTSLKKAVEAGVRFSIKF